MPRTRKRLAALVLLAVSWSLAASISVWAQQAQQPAQGGNANPGAQNAQQLPPETIRPNYVLGPNDQILVRAPEAEEIDNRPFRIDGDGNINLPLVGHIHAAGMSLQEMEADLV